ncbi:MAG: sensor histidine kinase [Alkaliphilus sp.]
MAKIIGMNLATNFIDTLLVFYFVKTVFSGKITNRGYTLILLMGLVLLNTQINISFGLANFLGSVAIIIISTTFFSFLLNISFVRMLLACLIAVVFMFLIEIFVSNAIVIVSSIPPKVILEMSFYRVLAILTAKTLFFLFIYFVVNKKSLINYVMIRQIYPIIFIVFFNITVIFMMIVLFKYIELETSRDYVYLIGMSIGMIIFSGVIYNIIKRLKLQNEREIIWNMKEKEHKNQEFYIKNMKDILQTIKAQRHDFNNFMSTLYGMMQIEKYDEAKKFITKLGNDISCMNEIIETNHPVITAIINIKRQRAISEKVDMEIFTELPEKISVDYIDLSIILGNLLDNALEACKGVQEEERVIELFMIIRGKYLIIKVANSKTNEVKLDEINILGRFTTKKDSENHGFGLNNIKQVVNQYNGIIKIEDEGNNFKVDIALLLGEDDE